MNLSSMSSSFNVGQLVKNFGAIVRVIAIDSKLGLLVEIIDVNGQGGVGQKYYANPSKCSAA
jgi:hypothetical protein